MSDHKQKIGFLFDLDGVLIDSENEYSKIWSQINREFPSSIPNLEQVIKGCTLTKILNDHYPDKNIQKLVECRLHQLENQMNYNYLPFAKEFLINLKNLGFQTALVTSSDNEKMKHLKEEIPDIFDFFNIIITGDMVKTSKPAPEGYLLAASKLNKRPENCVVFEDSLQGVSAGENAGAYVVGIEGTLPKETLSSHSDIVIKNFKDLNLENLIQILTFR